MEIVVAHAYNKTHWLVYEINYKVSKWVETYQLKAIDLVNRDLRYVEHYDIWMRSKCKKMYLLGKYKDDYVVFTNKNEILRMTADKVIELQNNICNIKVITVNNRKVIRLIHGKFLDIPLALLEHNIDKARAELFDREKNVRYGINMRSLKDLSNGKLPIEHYINERYKEKLMQNMENTIDLGRLLYGTSLDVGIENLYLSPEIYTTILFGEKLLVKLDKLDLLKRYNKTGDEYVKLTKEFMNLYTEYLIELLKCFTMFSRSTKIIM